MRDDGFGLADWALQGWGGRGEEVNRVDLQVGFYFILEFKKEKIRLERVDKDIIKLKRGNDKIKWV